MTSMLKIYNAIKSINSNADVAVRGTNLQDYEIEWRNGTTPIPKADIEAKMVEVQQTMMLNNIKEIEFILALEIN